SLQSATACRAGTARPLLRATRDSYWRRSTMSEVFEDTPIPPNTPPDPPPPVENKTPAPKPAKPRKWRRRILRLVIVLLGVMVILRGSLRFLVPWAINRAASAYNLRCTYERMDLYLVDGDVGIWHLKIEPKEGGAPLAQA